MGRDERLDDQRLARRAKKTKAEDVEGYWSIPDEKGAWLLETAARNGMEAERLATEISTTLVETKRRKL